GFPTRKNGLRRNLRPKPKVAQPRTKTQVLSSACTESVLEACLELSRLGAEPGVLREHIVSSAGKIYRAAVAGMMVRDGDSYLPVAVSAEAEDATGAEALLSHSRSFAIQAIEQKRLLNFRFSYRSPEGEAIYHGLAQPLRSRQSVAVLLVVRSAVFSPEEVAAFGVLGDVGRLSLEKSELTGLSSAQKHELEQLLEISGDLGTTSRLETFLPKFVVQAADFLGFSRAFVALVDTGECRLRWGANKGVPSRLEIDVSALASRALETRNQQTCEDASQLAANERAQLRRWESGLKQYLGIPLTTGDGRPLGLFGLLDKKKQSRITPEDVRRARVLGAELTVALEAAHNLQLSDQHRKRTEDLMEMALDLGSALRLPDF